MYRELSLTYLYNLGEEVSQNQIIKLDIMTSVYYLFTIILSNVTKL